MTWSRGGRPVKTELVLLWEFARAVIKHWGTLATGGVIVAVVWWRGSVLGIQEAPAFSLALGISFLIAATFLAWRDKLLEIDKAIEKANQNFASDRQTMLGMCEDLMAKNRDLTEANHSAERVTRVVENFLRLNAEDPKWRGTQVFFYLQRAGCGTLQSAAEVERVVAILGEHQYPNPFEDIEDILPTSEWLDFVRASKGKALIDPGKVVQFCLEYMTAREAAGRAIQRPT
jgi:hypothetical protein